MKLKLLAGALNGAEYSVGEGDTVFVVGPLSDLLGGGVAHTFASADNVYFVPDERAKLSFVVRRSAQLSAEGVGSALELGLADASGHWHFMPIDAQRVQDAAGVPFAMRSLDESWSREVLEFRPSQALTTEQPVPVAPRNLWKYYWVPGAALLVVAAIAAALFWIARSAPQTKVKNLEAELRGAPVAYAVSYGSDKRLYAFSDSAEGVAWGQRAVERLGRSSEAVFLQRDAEAERLGRRLTESGVDYVVIRLRDPAHPEIVLHAPACPDAARSAQRCDEQTVDFDRVRTLLSPSMPYAKRLEVEAISDRRLMQMVRDDLRSRGISSRVDLLGQRIGISNDAFLDDASLHAMARYRQAFVQQWGSRRISINILLWDDSLKGNSFHFTSDQLLSIGEGVWRFSNPVSKATEGI